jgi:hypothetical protein
MCNCGKKRNAFQSQSNTTQQNQPVRQNYYQRPIETPPQTNQAILFQYTGNTALTIAGSITRKNYRFNFPGDVQHIALSDVASMSKVHVLKRV